MSTLVARSLHRLLELPGVDDAVRAARKAVDDVRAHPVNRRGWPTTAAEASVRAARASAALEGASTDIPEDGQVRDPVLAGALRVAEAIGPLLTIWQRSPSQALARLHVLAATDLVNDPEELGRPRVDDAVSARLALLSTLLADSAQAPGAVLAAIVHGELLALAPFDTANGVVARGAARLTAISTGLDPQGLTVPEVAHLRRSPEYHLAVADFAQGTAEGVGAWIIHYCRAVELGAREAHGIAEAVGG